MQIIQDIEALKDQAAFQTGFAKIVFINEAFHAFPFGVAQATAGRR